MIRKMLVVAAAIAMPVSVVAVTGGIANAGVKPPPDPAVTCTISATVTLRPSGHLEQWVGERVKDVQHDDVERDVRWRRMYGYRTR